ncbi:MAG: YdcF family protein [bacterium]|nr:YdcF family protein [bacterium]
MEKDGGYTRRQVIAKFVEITLVAGGTPILHKLLRSPNLIGTVTNRNTITPNPQSPVDALAVLGAGVERKNGKYVPSFDGKMRVMAAAEAYRKNAAPIVVFMGGKDSKNYPSGAEVMHNLADRKYQQGSGAFSRIPREAVILEERSEHTDSEMEELAKLAKINGWKRIGIVTNRYHMEGAMILARNFGIDAVPIFAEDLLLKRDRRFAKVIKKCEESDEMKNKKMREMLRSLVLLFDPKARILRRLRGDKRY